jgi:nicotinamide riboside transporter PnuC
MLVGISGKRLFDKTSVQADREIAGRVADRLRGLFGELDDQFPRTPKILLSGFAFGADLIAAETALQCSRKRNWLVAALLPFGRALFEEDFRPPDGADAAWCDHYAEHARTFVRILADPQVIVRELPPLRIEDQGDTLADRLSRQSPHYDKVVRRSHYEQVGQFIAEAATVMIAVMSPDEQTDEAVATGGTARIVAYRRAGQADAAGTEVARRSAILRSEWPRVDLAPLGHVWLIDPNEHPKARRSAAGFAGCMVLPPLFDRLVEETYAGYPGKDMPREPRAPAGPLRALTSRLAKIESAIRARDLEECIAARRLRASLALPQAFERYHREEAAASLEVADIQRPADWLESYRLRISGLQRAVNERVRKDFNWLAWLFVLAVLLFEIFEKFSRSSSVLLGLYLLVLCLIGFFAWFAWSRQLNEVAEDYRAVAEMLRVQRAWWSAGLCTRVDREHLQGADQNLAPIRDCAKTIISWLLLRHDWPEPTSMLDWAHVRGTAREPREFRDQKRPPADWIGGQLWYFVNRTEAREKQVNVNNALSWCLFVTSGVLGLLLLFWLASAHLMAAFTIVAAAPAGVFGGSPAFDVGFLLWLSLAALAVYFRCLNHDIAQGWRALLLTFFLGFLAALFSFLALVDVGPLLARVLEVGAPDAVTSATQVALVVLSALAGALRYRLERLNIEAEALEYRDAHARFALAEYRLAAALDPMTGAPADAEEARALIRELGCAALAENEAWLKSRRERPLTPIVG